MTIRERMQKTGDFQSIYNTPTVKYTGPLSIVHYDGPRNRDNQMHGDGSVLFANGSTYIGSFGDDDDVIFFPLMDMHVCYYLLVLLTENDMLCGSGALSDPNSQSVYQGEFRSRSCMYSMNGRSLCHGNVNNLPVLPCR